jgi:hypothetical protein
VSDRFVCSDASEARGEEVTATASQVRAWLLVEVHGAWGVDAIAESELGVHLPRGWKADLERRGIRPICIRPAVRGDRNGPIRLFFVVAARPGRTTGVTWTRTVPTLSAVHYLSDDLSIGDRPHGWERHDERVVIVCTNGRHDQCCANRGRPVIRHLRETRWADQVWECSHIGGDRFAANLVVLPDSLYFGRMEPDEAEALLDAHADGRIALEWYRGRSTLRYVEQAAEQAIRRELDVRAIDDVEIGPSPEDGRVRAEVRGIGALDVVMERSIELSDDPLTCRGTPLQKVPHHTAVEITPVDG